MPRDPLYPPIEPFRTGRLRVDEIHSLYWEESGRPDGAPVIFLHGGPGAGASPTHRRFFDPQHYRAILFDQRGAGRSKPLGEIASNSPDLLVADLEQLRRHLGVERWHVFGGSWGSTLALLYAQAHPDRCISLILRGIFLMQRREIDWFLTGMRTIFPEAWERFMAALPAEEQADPLESYYRRLINPDRRIALPAARAWSGYEAACSTLLPSPSGAVAAGSDRQMLALARIEAHFFRNHLLEPESRLMDGLDRIRAIPTTIVQGRYDIVCPIVTADKLHRAWPEARYVIVPDAGHATMEPGIRAALLAAMRRHRTAR